MVSVYQFDAVSNLFDSRCKPETYHFNDTTGFVRALFKRRRSLPPAPPLPSVPLRPSVPAVPRPAVWGLLARMGVEEVDFVEVRR